MKTIKDLAKEFKISGAWIKKNLKKAEIKSECGKTKYFTDDEIKALKTVLNLDTNLDTINLDTDLDTNLDTINLDTINLDTNLDTDLDTNLDTNLDTINLDTNLDTINLDTKQESQLSEQLSNLDTLNLDTKQVVNAEVRKPRQVPKEDAETSLKSYAPHWKDLDARDKGIVVGFFDRIDPLKGVIWKEKLMKERNMVAPTCDTHGCFFPHTKVSSTTPSGLTMDLKRCPFCGCEFKYEKLTAEKRLKNEF